MGGEAIVGLGFVKRGERTIAIRAGADGTIRYLAYVMLSRYEWVKSELEHI